MTTSPTRSLSMPFILIIVTLLAIASRPLHANDVVVVSHQSFHAALQPWVQMRSQEGLEIAFTEPGITAERTAGNIKRLANEKTRYVLLVGDAPAIGKRIDQGNQTEIPTFYLPSRVTMQHGSTPTYPSDQPYTDLNRNDQSNIPGIDASVGRLPVTAPEQASALVSRIIAYEKSNDFSPWRRSLQLTAGVGGFGPLVDGAIEAVTRTVLTSALPAHATPQIAYASPGHAFCPVDQPFRECVLERYRNGSRFWIYAGHGRVDRLDLLKRSPQDADGLKTQSDSNTPAWTVESLLDNQSVSSLKADPARGTIALLLACYTGAFDAPGNSLAERMLLTPGGPVTVIAASRLTMPYGNARFGLSLLESIYPTPNNPMATPSAKPRLGDVFLATQQHLASEESGSATQGVVDGVAALISPAGTNLTAERKEHSGLYQLLGDPTLRLHRPVPIDLTAQVQKIDKDTTANTSDKRSVHVMVQSPIAGELTVHLDHPLGATSNTSSIKMTASAEHDPHGCTISQVRLSVTANQNVTTELKLPADWTGPVVVRAFVQGKQSWGSAATRKLVY